MTIVKKQLPREEGKKLIEDIKHAQKERAKQEIHDSAFIITLKSFVYIVFGVSSLTTSLVAALYVKNAHYLTSNEKHAIIGCIVVTILPAAYTLGKFIISGAIRTAKER